MHGVEVTTIMQWDMPLWETALGVIEIFVLGWLFGALIAGCYNCCTNVGASDAQIRKRVVAKPFCRSLNPRPSAIVRAAQLR